MVVGEAPGRQEDAQGKPFVGAAGRVLDELLEAAGLRRDQVYITNVVKSHPTAYTRGPNRAPRPEEVAACRPWLDAQLAIIRPRVVVTLGAHALHAFRRGAQISRVHGRPFQFGGLTVLPLFHPATALYGADRDTLRRDMRRLRDILAGGEAARHGRG
jgi:DNA polymerase